MALQPMAPTSRGLQLRIDTDVGRTSRPCLDVSQPSSQPESWRTPVTPSTPGALFSATSGASSPSPVTPSSHAPWSPTISSPTSRRPSDFDVRKYTNTVQSGEPQDYAILSPIKRLSSSLRGLGKSRSLGEVDPQLSKLSSTIINDGLNDWSLVEGVLRSASMTRANANSVLKSIIRSLMTGDGFQRLSAGRLWALMMKNANSVILDQSTQSDFLMDLERIISSSCIEMVVIDRIVAVLATSVHDFSSQSEVEHLSQLLRRTCARRVVDSTPLHPEDPLYHPGTLVGPSIGRTMQDRTMPVAFPYQPTITPPQQPRTDGSPNNGNGSRQEPGFSSGTEMVGCTESTKGISKHRARAIPEIVVEDIGLPPPYSPSAISRSDAGPSLLRMPSVIDTYPFAKGYASDIGPDINMDSLEPYPFARGAFGDVRRAFLRDGRRVAIKCLRFYTSAQDTGRHKLEKKSLKEISVWSFLEHENVLPLLGLCVVNNELGMVSEFMPNGNIQEYIRCNPAVDRYWLAINVCAGLAYLHEHPKHVVHGDLKAVNVVVDANGIPKLTDFGLAQMIRAEDSTERSSSSWAGGTSRWMARELICPTAPNIVCCKPNPASDVYSLGMTIYEMFSGILPFSNRKNDAQVIFAIMQHELPERVPNVFTEELWELLLRCWRLDPCERPTAREILVALQDLRHAQNDLGKSA